MKHETFYLYDDRKDVSLTTYLLEPTSEILNGAQRPLVLICPGGGYLYCSDREAEPIALAFNAMGYHAAVLRYSTCFGTKDKIKPNADINPDPDKIFPQPMIEIAMAFELIHSYSNEWNVDSQAIGLCGFSAGGHNASMYATHWHKSIIQNATQLKKQALQPAFLISGYGLLDLEYAMAESYRSEDPQELELANKLLLATTGQSMASNEDLQKLSPVNAVTKKTPPTFLWATSEDKVVNPQDTAQMAVSLAREGVLFEMHVYEEGVHGLSTANYASANARDQLNNQANHWLRDVEAWLTRHISLDSHFQN